MPCGSWLGFKKTDRRCIRYGSKKTSIPIITSPIKESKASCLKLPPLKKNIAIIEAKSTPKVPISGCKIKKDAIKALIIKNGKSPNLNEPTAFDFDSNQAAR